MRGTFVSGMESRFVTLLLQIFFKQSLTQGATVFMYVGFRREYHDSPQLFVCEKHGRAFVLAMFSVVRRHIDEGPLISPRFVFKQSGGTRVAFVLTEPCF